MKKYMFILTVILVFLMNTLAHAAILGQQQDQGDWGSPAFLLFVLFSLAVLVVLVGIGIVIGIALLASAAIFVAVGVISSSALVGLLRRRASASFSALYYQMLALIGIPGGIAALWLAAELFHFPLRHRYILECGSFIGILAGLTMAYILNLFIRFACRRFSPGTGSQTTPISTPTSQEK